MVGQGELESVGLSDGMQSSDSEIETNDSSKYPPCIRAILIESAIENFDLGSLFLIPYTGGIVGSGEDRSKYVLHFPGVDKIDQIHASIRYDRKKKIFLIRGFK